MTHDLSPWMAGGLTCRDIAERITDYLDDRLPMPAKFRMASHMASCGDCHAYLKQILLVRNTLARLPKRGPSTATRLCLRQHFAAVHLH